MNYYRRSRHPQTLLLVYYLFLTGSSDAEIMNNTRANEADLSKIKRFNDSMSKNKHYISASCEIGIDLQLGKRMFNMYHEKQNGLPLSYQSHRIGFRNAFKMLLEGKSDMDILANGNSELQLNKAKEFLHIAPDADKLLLAVIGQKFGIARESVAAMLRIYRDQKAEIMRIEDLQDNRIIPITSMRK